MSMEGLTNSINPLGLSEGITYFELNCLNSRTCLYLKDIITNISFPKDISFTIQARIPSDTKPLSKEQQSFIKLNCGSNIGYIFCGKYKGDKE
ncbi:MAG: hypothetical protein P8X70_02105 [Nanoarchaeota archaeon]